MRISCGKGGVRTTAKRGDDNRAGRGAQWIGGANTGWGDRKRGWGGVGVVKGKCTTGGEHRLEERKGTRYRHVGAGIETWCRAEGRRLESGRGMRGEIDGSRKCGVVRKEWGTES